jgi:hypothetical protein
VVSPHERKPYTVAYEHLRLIEFLARYPSAAQVAHQHLAQVCANSGHRVLVDALSLEDSRKVLVPELVVHIAE